MKKLLLVLFSIVLISQAQIIFAQNPDFEIIPKAQTDVWSNVKTIWDAWWDVRKTYNEEAEKLKWKVWDQIASWIMTRSTLLDYAIYVIKFLSQAWLLLWALMIIYAWYIYASSIFTGKETWAGKKAVTNAILWVLIIVFSYAIIKLITSAFIS